MDIDRLIINWYNKAYQEEDYFSKFVFEYLAFIAFLRKVKKEFRHRTNLFDRNVIEEFKQLKDTKNAYLQRIKNSDELQKAWEHIIKTFKEKPFSDAAARNLGLNEHRYWEGVINNLEDWDSMVEFWYCVRNNLFHGEKDPDSSRDEFAVEFGYKTLKELVKLLLEEELSEYSTTNQAPEY